MKQRTWMVNLATAAGLAAAFLLAGCQGGAARASGSTTITLHAQAGGPSGALDQTVLDQATLGRAGDLLTRRLTNAGMTGVQVTVDGSDGLRVRVDGHPGRDRLASLVGPGQLSFRRVLASQPAGSPGAADPGPSSGTPAVDASGTAGGSSGGGTPAGHPPTLGEVEDLLGPAYEIATGLPDPVQPGPGQTGSAPPDAQTLAALAPFAALTPAQVAVLPADLQYRVPTISCGQLNGRTPPDDPASPLALCDGQTRYLLDVAGVTGPDVASAKAASSSNGVGWLVNLQFTSSGQARWTALTQQVVQGSVQPGAVAIVLDARILSVPVVQQVIVGDTQISGSFDKAAARDLAAEISAGMLPVTFAIAQLTTD